MPTTLPQRLKKWQGAILNDAYMRDVAAKPPEMPIPLQFSASGCFPCTVGFSRDPQLRPLNYRFFCFSQICFLLFSPVYICFCLLPPPPPLLFFPLLSAEWKWFHWDRNLFATTTTKNTTSKTNIPDKGTTAVRVHRWVWIHRLKPASALTWLHWRGIRFHGNGDLRRVLPLLVPALSRLVADEVVALEVCPRAPTAIFQVHCSALAGVWKRWQVFLIFLPPSSSGSDFMCAGWLGHIQTPHSSKCSVIWWQT